MRNSKLFLTSLLAAAAMSAVPAWAESYTATGDVKGNSDGACVIYGDGTITDSSGATRTGNISLYAGDIVTFNAASGHLHGYRNDTFVADIVLGENATSGNNYSGYALYIYRGEGGGKTQTFSGSVSGSGSMGFGGSEANVTTYIFTGNATGLTGNINAESQTSGGLRFGLNGTTASAYSSAAAASDGVILNISGTGSITTGNSLVYNYTGGANGETLSVNNTSLTAKTLTFGGGATYTVASTVSGKSTTASDNTLTISAGTTTFTGAVSNFGNVTVANGATLAVGATGSLNLSGANVTLASAIQNSGAVTVSDSTVFVLADALKDGGSDSTWNIITGNTSGITGWNDTTLNIDNFRRSDGKYLSGRSTIDFSSAGSVTITGGAYNLFWKSGVTAWNSDTEFDKDSAGSGTTSPFETYDNVTFSTGDVTVTVAEDGVTAGTVKITAGIVTLSSGKVTAQDGFFVGDGVSEDDSAAILVLSSSNALCGDVTVNKGGTFDLNAQSDSMSESGRIGKVVLNGGSLKSTGGTSVNSGTVERQIYNLEVTADSKIIGDGTFGILGSGYAVTTLNLGANTLTKSGSGLFVLVKTTISGNGGVLDVTEGKILGKIPDNNGDHMLTLGEGVTLKTSGTGGAENIRIASMAANSKLILGGSTESTVALNSFALGAGAVIDVSGANSVTGTITAMGEGSSLKLAGTTASSVTLSGDIGANANVAVASGSSLTGTDRTTISVGANTTLSSAGTVSVYSLTLSNTSSATVTGGTFGVSDESEGLWVRGGATFTVEGGVATVGRLVLNAGAESENAANVEVTGGVLNVTRATEHGVVLGSHKGGATHVISVSGDGVFNATGYAITVAYASNGKISVSGGEMNVKGFTFSGQNNKDSTLEVTGGRLNIGALGITQAGTGKKEVLFSNATIGALDSWSGASAITLGGTVIFDTTKMVASTSGKSSVDAANTAGTMIELSGKIFGSGTLKKIGAGTLTLSGANDFTGNIEIAEGVVVTTHPYSLGLADATVKLSGGQLQVNASTNGAIVQTAISIVLSDAYSSTAAITGAGALATDTTITIADVDVQAAAIAAESALGNDSWTFQIATEGSTIANSLAKENFVLAEALQGTWQISDYTNGVLTLTIPEPSVFGLLAGLGALALAGTRRRRQKKA